jgi:hypothetical protein
MNGMISTKNNTLMALIYNDVLANKTVAMEALPSGIWEIDLSNKNCTHRYSFCLKSLSSSTITDFGQNIIAESGALGQNLYSSDTSTPGRSTILAGAKIYTDATTT